MKTQVSHHFLQVSWSLLSCSAFIWPQQTALNSAHLIKKITFGILGAINSGLMITVLCHIKQIWKTLLLSLKKNFQETKIQHGLPASCLQGVSAPTWVFLRVHQGDPGHPVLECGSKGTKVFYQPGMLRVKLESGTTENICTKGR